MALRYVGLRVYNRVIYCGAETSVIILRGFFPGEAPLYRTALYLESVWFSAGVMNGIVYVFARLTE